MKISDSANCKFDFKSNKSWQTTLQTFFFLFSGDFGRGQLGPRGRGNSDLIEDKNNTKY